MISVLLTPNLCNFGLARDLSLSVDARLRGLHIVRISIGHTGLMILLKFNALIIFGLRSILHSLICILSRLNHIWQKCRTFVVIVMITVPLLPFLELFGNRIVFIMIAFWNLEI